MPKMSRTTCARTPIFSTNTTSCSTQLTVPHPQHGGQAISPRRSQFHALRDKIRQLEVKLAELIRFGEENDDISTKVHRLSVVLLEAGSVDSVRQALVDSLRDDFAVPHVSLKLGCGGHRRCERGGPSGRVRGQ